MSTFQEPQRYNPEKGRILIVIIIVRGVLPVGS